ncbi:MAG: hypothetical protein ACW99A_06445 [Candidatus Kariarchaeaceae archaeon]|jgi:hypothetical protein
MKNPELLLRSSIVDEFSYKAVLINLDELIDVLKKWPGVWWNAYSQKYGNKIKEFPYEARNGFFIDINKRMATHRFTSSGIVRRDRIFDEKEYEKIVIEQYQPTWYDIEDAVRCYSVLITSINELDDPIPVENFGLFNSWGRVSSTDLFHRPRLIKATWKEN